MGRRRVRWGNVGGLAALAGAAALIATGGPQAPQPPPRPQPPPKDVQQLPRLRDIPRLDLPRPRERRALKAGPYGVDRVIRGKVREHPGEDGPSAPSPQSGPAGQPATPERSAPVPAPPTAEFTPDPGP